MDKRKIIALAGILGALAVGIGAFGAHGLKDYLTSIDRLDTFETAVKYHFYHTLAILAIGVALLYKENSHWKYAVYCWLSGIVIFSGSLYALCLSNVSLLGAITPIGGIMFIVGWIFLATGTRKL